MTPWSGILWLCILLALCRELPGHNLVPKHQCTLQVSSGAPPEKNLRPDHFKRLGKVKNMDECLQRCCDVQHCDLAMMSYGGRNCYGVACYSENLCQMLPSYPTRISFDVSHVVRREIGNGEVKLRRAVPRLGRLGLSGDSSTIPV